MRLSPPNRLPSAPIERCPPCAVRAPRRPSSRRLEKKVFEFEVEVSGTASGTPHKGEASRRRQSAPSFSASTAPRKRSSSSWRAAACWKSAARVSTRVEPAARRRHGRRHRGCGRFAAARTVRMVGVSSGGVVVLDRNMSVCMRKRALYSRCATRKFLTKYRRWVFALAGCVCSSW